MSVFRILVHEADVVENYAVLRKIYMGSFLLCNGWRHGFEVLYFVFEVVAYSLNTDQSSLCLDKESRSGIDRDGQQQDIGDHQRYRIVLIREIKDE